MILCKHRQNVRRIETVEVVNERCRFAQPLSVKFAPHGFCPARVGNGEMQSVGVYAMPEFCGVEMSERVFVVMNRRFRITRRARGEEHQQRVVAARRIFGPLKCFAESDVFLVKITPAVAFAVYNYLCFQLRTFFRRKFRLMCRVSVRRAENCAYARRIEAVFKIVFKQLVCCKNGYRAEFVQPEHSTPELVVSFQNEHYAVAFFDTEGSEIVRTACGEIFHIEEREPTLRFIF